MLDVAALIAKERRFGLQARISVIFYKMLVSLFHIQFLCFFLVSDGFFFCLDFFIFFLFWVSCISQCDSPATKPQLCREQDLAEGYGSSLEL